jgi:hypothetical protein
MLRVWIVRAVDATREDWLSTKACLEGTGTALSFDLLVAGSERRYQPCQFLGGILGAIAVTAKAVCQERGCESSVEARPDLHQDACVLIHNGAGIRVRKTPLPGICFVWAIARVVRSDWWLMMRNRR